MVSRDMNKNGNSALVGDYWKLGVISMMRNLVLLLCQDMFSVFSLLGT